MGTVIETPPKAGSVSAEPRSEAKPLASVAAKVPLYRRIDMRYVSGVCRMDPGAVPGTELPMRIEKLGQSVFVESPDIFAPGALVSISIKAPQHAEPYRAEGVVRWISDEPHGIGVQLYDVVLVKPGDGIPAPPASAASPAPADAPPRFSLPDPAGVSELLSGLLGKTIEANVTGKWEPSKERPGLVAAFGPDDGPATCLWVFDLTACVYAGGALTMLPAEECKKAVAAKELRDSFVENVREIFNVGASLFNAADGASVKLKNSYLTSGEMPDTVKRLLAATDGRLDLEITVPDYGKGSVSVIVS